MLSFSTSHYSALLQWTKSVSGTLRGASRQRAHSVLITTVYNFLLPKYETVLLNFELKACSNQRHKHFKIVTTYAINLAKADNCKERLRSC